MNKKLGLLAQQFHAIWNQIGLNQRISLVLAGAVVFLGLLTIGWWSTRTGYATLTRDLSDEQNAKVVAMLEEEKVDYRIGADGHSLEVPEDQVHLMKMRLAEKRIPAGDGRGWRIFDEPNLGVSETVLRINRLRALQEELAMTIRQFDEVGSARVVLTMPENRLLLTDSSKPTAAVFVQLAGSRLSNSTVSAIQFLVGNAVEGLEIENVSVMDNTGRVMSGVDDRDSIGGMADNQLEASQKYEKYFTMQIQRALDRAVGPNRSIVNVRVELDTDTLSQTEVRHNPEAQILLKETTTEEIQNQVSGEPRPGAGMQANTGANATTNAPSGSPAFVENSGSTNKVINKEYAVDRTTSTLQQVAGGVKKVTAAVLIDVQYETATNGVERIIPRTPEELLKLKNYVKTALGIEQEVDISLEEMEFNNQHIQEMSRQFKQVQDRQFYWEIGRQALYVLLPIVLFLALVRMVKRASIEEIPLGIPLGEEQEDADKENEEEDSWMAGGVTVEVLNRLIRENPENMTQAIRHWLHHDTSQN